LYAYFLAAIYRIFGHHYEIVRIIQVVLGSCTWALVYLIGSETFGKRTGIIAGVAGALYGYSIFLDSELLKNSLAVFTMTASLYLIVCGMKREKTVYWPAAGIFLGLTILNQPNVLLLIPVFMMAATGPGEWSLRKLIPVLFLVLGAVAVVAPVTVRNYVVEKDRVLVSSNGGLNFFIANNRESDGGIITSSEFYEIDPRKQQKQSRRMAEAETGRQMRSSEVSRFWFSLGMRFPQEEPMAFVKLLMKKVMLFWNAYEVPDNLDYYFMKRYSKLLALSLISFGIVAPLALLGLGLSFREYRRHILFYAVILIFMASVAAFMVFARYRVTIFPLLAVYAAYAADRIYAFLKERDIKAMAFSAAALAVLAYFSHLGIISYPPEYSRKILADMHMKRGQCSEAMQEYEGALKTIPENLSLRINYAVCLQKCGKENEALREYDGLLSHRLDPSVRSEMQLVIARIFLDRNDLRQAEKRYIELLEQEDNAEALNNLAWIYYAEGIKLKEARAYSEKALYISPDSAEYMDTLGMILMREKEFERAAELLGRASGLMPESAEIRRHFDEARRMSGGR